MTHPTLGADSAQSAWEQAAAVVLRKARRLGADEPDELVWERLAKRTLDGLEVPTLGVPSDVEIPDVRRNRGRSSGWDVRVRTPGGAEALAELETGATSLWLTLESGVTSEELDALLDGVLVDLAPVILNAPVDPVGASSIFCAWLAKRGVTAAVGTNLGADPIGRAVSTGSTMDLPGEVAKMAGLAQGAGVLGFVVDATVVHDRGASDVQELGYSLAAGAAYLRLLNNAGFSVDEAFGLLEFRYAATDEQFLTIAKFRAARQLWARVREICEAGPGVQIQRQHAVTSRPMMTRYDPWVNMLRTTVAAFAAGTGGADSVTVLPFDSALGVPDEFGRRIARNTSSLLIEESHVAKVADPAGGSYAVEQLTDELAGAAWGEFQRIEAAGGLFATTSDSSASVSDSSPGFGDVSGRRGVEIATRKRLITGVSEFPNPGEVLPERAPHEPAEWHVESYAAPYEQMRDEPRGTVFLATMGSLAEHTARAGFARNLLAAGGVGFDSAGATQGANDVLVAYAGQPVVMLTGSDAAYAEWGAELIAALRSAGATRVILAGKPRDLEVDDSFAQGDDALAFLGRTREALS